MGISPGAVSNVTQSAPSDNGRLPLADDAQALVVVPVIDAALDAVRRAARAGAVIPRPAAQQPGVVLVAVGPRRIGRRADPVIAAAVVAVEHPLVEVAVRVVQAEG